MTHALEGMEDLQLDWVVLTSTDLGEKELISRKIGVGEVEFNLKELREY